MALRSRLWEEQALQPHGDHSIYTELDLPEIYDGQAMTEEQARSELTQYGADWSQIDKSTFTSWGRADSNDPSDNGQRLYIEQDKPMPLRLLEIVPADCLGEDIVCRLRVTTMPSAGQYDALSYTWGDASYRRFIHLNGKRVPVTANLWNALRYLRRTDSVRVVWVDALCINQTNTVERNYMVSQMYAIYNNAQRTISWLGEATSQSNEAINFLAEQLQESAILHDIFQPRVARGGPMSDAHRDLWEALADLFGRSWWTRAWIVQEVGCAYNWTLMCGRAELNGQDLGPLLVRIYDAASRLPASMLELSLVIRSFRGIGTMQMLRQPVLGSHLARNRARQSTDPRDKVYAFTNMIMPPIRDLYPNYDQSIQELYYQTAIQLIKTTGNLRVLTVCEWQRQDYLDDLTKRDGIPREAIAALPSWVPNWALERVSTPLWGGYEHISMTEDKYFRAAGNAAPTVKYHGSSLAESRGILTVRGCVIDILDEMGHDFYGEKPIDVAGDADRLLRDKRYMRKPDDDGTSALLRTLTLDRDVTGQRAFREIAEDADAIRQSLERAIVGRVFYRTNAGFIGMGPRAMKKGDIVVIIFGCHVPLVLRSAQYIQGEYKRPCRAHAILKVCSARGCVEEVAVVTERYKVVGETCKFECARTPVSGR